MTERTKYEIRSVETGQVLDTTICPIVARALHGNGFTVSPEPGPANPPRVETVQELRDLLDTFPGDARVWTWAAHGLHQNAPRVFIDNDGDLLILHGGGSLAKYRTEYPGVV